MNTIDLNNIAIVQLTNSFDFAIIDKELEEKVKQYKWCLARGQVYSTKKITNSSWYLSRLVTGSKRMDHINRNKLDCRRCNFREATESQNGANKDKYLTNTSSKYKGVFFRKDRGTWTAQICKNQVKHHGGVFRTEREAAIAANSLMLKLFGEFAVLNQIDSVSQS